MLDTITNISNNERISGYLFNRFYRFHFNFKGGGVCLAYYTFLLRGNSSNSERIQ